MPPFPVLPRLPTKFLLTTKALAGCLVVSLGLAFLVLPQLALPFFSLLLQFLIGLWLEDLRPLQLLVIPPLGMGALTAVLAVGTKAGEIERAQVILLDVPVGAPRAQWTEAAFVPRTDGPLTHRVHVQVQAVVAVWAGLMTLPVGALTGLAQVELMQELAGGALLA